MSLSIVNILCCTDFDGFTPYVKNLGKKQAVTAQSLTKIEDGESPLLLASFVPWQTSFPA